MFELTKDLYNLELATAVYEHLQGFLLTKENNHCQRVEYLPLEVMMLTCQKVRDDEQLKAKNVEAYVLSKQAQGDYEIESGALIEKRNRENFGILVAFIPQGLRLPAEDSYDIQTFKTYDLGIALKSYLRQKLSTLSQDKKDIVNRILSQSAIKRLPIEKHLKYVLALINDAIGWEEAGAYLFYLDLIPDLKLSEEESERRIDRNYHCVNILSNADNSVFMSIEKLVNEYGLETEINNLRENLMSFFRDKNIVDKERWLEEILKNKDWRSKLTFDKWRFKDITKPGEIELNLESLEDPITGRLARGIRKEGTNLVASTNPRNPIHLRWSVYPRNPENLGHFLLVVVRDTDDEETNEDLLRRNIKGNRASLKLNLNDIELAEGETCAAKIILYAKDTSGIVLASDESEPFWIEGGIQIEDTINKKINKIRNRAEAFLQAARKYHKLVELDSEGWEETRPRMFRLKLKSRDIYRITINPALYEIERRNIENPSSLGIWFADVRNRAILDICDLKRLDCQIPDISAIERFISNRKKLFSLFQERDPAGIIETFDLREFKVEIQDYIDAYLLVLNDLSVKLKKADSDAEINNILNTGRLLMGIDTVKFEIGTTDDEENIVMLAPTHPLKMLWVLQYQQLLFNWAEKLVGASDVEAEEMINNDSFEQISSLNIPSAFGFAQNEIYINSDNLDLYWSIFPKGESPDIRKVVSQIIRLLDFKTSCGEITSITPLHIADKIWRYLKHHPYVSTLKLNVINPGDGLLILNAIRELQKNKEFQDLSYDIAFYGNVTYEIMGSAFDKLMEGALQVEMATSEIDESLLRPNKNPLFPKLIFSKHRVRESDWTSINIRESHIAILIDRFSTKVVTRQTDEGIGSFCLHNLLAEYLTTFDIKGDSATWSRKIVPDQNNELFEGDNCANRIYKIDDLLLRLSACFYNWGNALDKVPTIQLELSDIDKYIITQIHEKSDWVLTIDRNFGIEYFDNPLSAPGVSVRSYLIDYTPEFLEGIGHRLIVSTFWLSEIEGLIQDGLRKMGIPGTGFHAAQILDVLKSISGRLALKLINNPNDAREIIGLALTRLLLEQNNELKDGVIIPVDSHINIFTQYKKKIENGNIRIHRSDLILAKAKEESLCLKLIEVKFRSGTGTLAEEITLKEAIFLKNSDTQKVLESKFFPSEIKCLDKEMRNKQFASLIQFYFKRALRHGLITAKSNDAENIQRLIKKIEKGKGYFTFEKVGYIFNLQGISKEVENYKDNEIYVVGKDKIYELLDISEDEEISPAEPAVVKKEGVAPLDSITKAQAVKPIEKLEEKIKEKPIDKKKMEQSLTQKELVEIAEEPTKGGVKLTEKEFPTVEEKPQIRILLGKDRDSGNNANWDPFTTNPKKLANQHILIVGKSGAGKTQTASAFIYELSKTKIPSVIFDFQGEYMSQKLVNAENKPFLEVTNSQVLDASDGIDINPLDVPIDPHFEKKQNYMKVVYQVSMSLAKIFKLGDIQHAILRDATNKAFTNKGFSVGDKNTWNNTPPTFSEVWEILKSIEKREGGNARNLNLRIQPLFETGVFVGCAESKGIEEILKQNSIICLSNLATKELMVAVSRFVLQKLYSYMLTLGPTNNLRIFTVIDEAHKLSYEETLTELIREARKYGVGILLASQSVKDFDRIVFDMVGTKIVLQLEGDEARIMSDNMGLISRSDRNIIQELILQQPPHRAILRSNHYEPYIQIDTIPFWKKE